MAETSLYARPERAQERAWRVVLAFTALVAFIFGMSVVRQAMAVDNETTYIGTTIWDTGYVDDSASSALNLGFTFNFYGTNYTQGVMTSNGVFNFGPSGNASYSNSALPGSVTNSVFVFWDDLILTSVSGASQSTMQYTTVGTAPNRKFIGQWTGMYFYGTTVQMGTFQVILYETTNVIQLQYRTIVGTGQSQGSSATIGIQGSSAQYVQFLANAASSSLVDGFAIKYTPNGSSYTQTAGATYDPVNVITSTGVDSPVLVSPTDGATGVSTLPTLSWNQVTNATGYKVYVATDAQFGSMIAGSPFSIASGSTTSWTASSALTAGAKYYWKVESLRNALSSLSGTRSFTTSAVVKSSQATLTASIDNAALSVGGTANLSSTGGSGSGAVTYAVASGSAYCSISGSVLTATAAGTCTVSATKAADASYYSATSAAITVTVANVVTYNVTYNGNNNTGGSVPGVGSGNANSTYTVASNSGSLVRAGYTFSGWNTAANGSGTNYTEGTGTFTLTGNTTLYANWTANTLTVTYNTQGGSTIASGSTVTGGSIATSPGTPTQAGYTFKGWFAASSGGTALTFPYTHGQTANFTVYAQWLTNQTGFAVSGAPASLAYQSTVTVGIANGGGTGAVSYASNTPSVCTVNATSGLVTMSVSSGTCTVSATKASDGTYASATATADIAAARASQSTLTVTSTTATYGQTLALTSSGGTGTGLVSWQVVSGSCTIAGSTLTPGDAGSSCVVRATKAQDTNYLAKDSADTSITINKASQSALTVTSLTATYGQPLTLTATGGSGIGGINWAKISGTCSVLGSTLTPGDAGSSCVVKATRVTDTNFLEASSSNTTITIQRATQDALAVTSTSATYGQSLSLTTSGGSGTGAVTWQVISGTCSVATSTLTPGDAGSLCVVRATKAQDTNYLVLASTDTTINIARATQATLVVSSPTATYGQTKSLSTSGGSGTGVVTWQVVSGSCTVAGSTLTPGDAGSSCVVRATKALDTNYLAIDSADTSITINKASQSTLTITSLTATYGQNLDLVAIGGSGIGGINWTKVSGTCSVLGSTLTPGDAGSSCVVKATRVTDTNFFEASSSNTTITIQRATQATLTVTSTSATYGQSLSLTTSGGSGAGAVTWQVVSGACSVNGSILSPSDAGSTCVIRATKAQDTNYLAVDSPDASVDISRATQTNLIVSSTTATYGQTLALTTSGGSGTGAVSWQVVSGSCSVTGAALTPGDAGSSCVVRATKAQDTNYVVQDSADTTININKAAQASLTVTSLTATYGQTLTLTATGGSGIGGINWTKVSGTCSVLGSTLTPGDAGSSCVVRATRVTDTNFLEGSSVNTTITIQRTIQATLTVTSTAAVYGQTLTLSATGGTGNGSVSWQVVSGTCSVTGSTLTPGDAGSSCIVRATKAQDTNYLAKDSADTSVEVARAVQSILSVSSTSVTYGQSLALATIGGSGTGAVSWQIVAGTCTVTGSTLTPGDAGSVCVVRATKAQDTNYIAKDSADTTVNVNRANQAPLTVTSTSATYGQPLTLSANGGSGTGTISWQVVSGTCSVSGSTLTPGNAGSSCVVRATRALDTNYNAVNSASTSISIAKSAQAGLLVTSPTFFTTGNQLVLTASGGQSTGGLTWSVSSGVCAVSGNTLTSSRGGVVCGIDVTRAGDNNYFADTESVTITVNKIVQTITFTSTPPNPANPGMTYTLTAESDQFLAPMLAVSNSSSSVCAISAGVVSFNAIGSCVVIATQAGNDQVAPGNASQLISVVAPAPTTTIAPSTTVGASGTVAVAQKDVAKPRQSTTTTSTIPTDSTLPAKGAAPDTTIPTNPGQPQVGADGKPVEVPSGAAVALVRGKPVIAKIDRKGGTIVVTLPNNVVAVIGSASASSKSAKVSSDGVLRTYTNDFVDVQTKGLVPGTTFTLYMFSQPVELGRGTADSKGEVITTVKIPKGVKGTKHTLQVNGVGKGGEVVSLSMGFEVMKRQHTTGFAILVISLAMMLAMLSGRPLRRRRRV